MLIFTIFEGDNDVEKSDQWITHTHEVIIEAEQLSTFIENMLASQRGYLITGNKDFLDEYQKSKKKVTQNIDHIVYLTRASESQTVRLNEIKNFFEIFALKLEERSQSIDPQTVKETLNDVKEIDDLRDNIIRINSDILAEEYNLLKLRVMALEQNRSAYKSQLLVGIIFGTLLLLLFNGFLLRAQRKRSVAERSLKSSEERFFLAIDGTQDGVFDWNLETDEVFYSKPYFRMLGLENKDSNGTTDDFKNYVHPDDIERVWQHAENYLNGQLSEYEQDFRMKHASGRWIWIKARAKAISNKKGKPIRMVGAHTDITALKKEQENLAIAKETAEKQSRSKSEFLAHMSHEIRTPLTAITGIGEILNKQKESFNEKQSQLIKTLNSSANTLKELITDILDFSKIESGEIELDEREFRLDTLFEETISMMSLKANEKAISFVFDYNPIKNSTFYGDSTRIRQILVNLVGNAIKFTDDGSVKVQCEFEDRDGHNFLRIDVSDTGIGITPEDFDLVFERFKQADASVSRKYGGTGLGLPISKQLAKLMGGDIFLSSEAGKGSTFSLLLPAEITSDRTKKSNAEKSDKINQKILSHLNEDIKILIVEDYEGNVVIMSYIIEDLGFKYDIARNGMEAVDMWKNNHYDLILMDVQMPEMDGFTATSQIRDQETDKKLDRTPIIGMTAHALVGDKDKCIAAGMDSYLPKPLVEADLKREMLKYLDREKKAA